MVATPLEFSLRIKLVVKYVSHIMEALERILREQVKPMVAGSLEPGRERSIEMKVVVSIDLHFVMVLTKM